MRASRLLPGDDLVFTYPEGLVRRYMVLEVPKAWHTIVVRPEYGGRITINVENLGRRYLAVNPEPTS